MLPKRTANSSAGRNVVPGSGKWHSPPSFLVCGFVPADPSSVSVSPSSFPRAGEMWLRFAHRDLGRGKLRCGSNVSRQGLSQRRLQCLYCVWHFWQAVRCCQGCRSPSACQADPVFLSPSCRPVPRLGDLGPQATGGECPGSDAASG